MVWLVIVLFILLVICLLRFHIYRNQMKELAENLEFIRENNSNLRITQEIRYPEVDEFIDQLNRLIQTHRKLEQEVLHKEQALKDLVTNLSHDIRTPLTSLDGYFELLKTCEDKMERERYNQIISGRIDSLKELLEQLFMYMKLQNDTYEIDINKCNVSKLLYRSMFDFYQDFTARGMEPTLNIPESDIYVNGNEIGLLRIFQNVIKNVLEHGQDKFTLNVTINKDNLVIEFRNLYNNENPIDVSQVFERFYKADRARTHTSTGLGLAIAKELVDRIGGTINAALEDNEFMIIIKMKIVENKQDESSSRLACHEKKGV